MFKRIKARCARRSDAINTPPSAMASHFACMLGLLIALVDALQKAEGADALDPKDVPRRRDAALAMKRFKKGLWTLMECNANSDPDIQMKKIGVKVLQIINAGNGYNPRSEFQEYLRHQGGFRCKGESAEAFAADRLLQDTQAALTILVGLKRFGPRDVTRS